MSNAFLNTSIIAKEALAVLDNNLVMAKLVYRGYEDEFSNSVNGYTPGSSISIRRPTDFTVRDGATAVNQDITEGTVTLSVDKQKGIDFGFTSQELTLNIKELSDRVIKPAMVQLANQIDSDLMGLYKYVPNWVGTPGQTINSFTDFALGPQLLDQYAVPTDGRAAVLSPADHWGLLGSQTSLYIQDAAKGAYREGSLGKIGGVDTYMSQNVPSFTAGADVTGTVGASITTSTTTYASVKTTMQQTITTANVTLTPGDVIKIQYVNAVNPVTKADLGISKQFTVISYSANSAVIYPAMIWSGPFQNITVASGASGDLNGATITSIATAATAYPQNMMFHKNAFTLVMVPMVSPPGAVDVARESYKGTSVRLIPTYDGTNDRSNYRLDVLYGVKAIDPRLATRISGT